MAAPPTVTASLQTLQTILSTSVLLTAFEEFARKERNEENLVLLGKIAEFKKADATPMRVVRAADILRLIRTGTVNASAKTRTTVESCIARLRTLQESGGAEVEAESLKELEAIEAVLLLLETTVHRELVGDALPRFLRSPQYQAAAEAIAPKSRRESVARGLIKTLGGSFRLKAGEAGAGGGGPGPLSPSAAASSASAAHTPLPFLSLGGVSERKQALLDMLSHSGACSCFVEFCRREHNDENVECLLDLQALRRLEAPELRKRKAREVLDTYIRSGSSKEANVDSRTRAQAETCLARSAATGAPLDAPEVTSAGQPQEADAPSSGASGFISVTTSAGSGGDPIGKVESELINMLSGEVLPRFVASRMWGDFVASYPGGQMKEGGGVVLHGGSGGGGGEGEQAGAGGAGGRSGPHALVPSASIASICEPLRDPSGGYRGVGSERVLSGGLGAGGVGSGFMGTASPPSSTVGSSDGEAPAPGKAPSSSGGGGGFLGFKRRDKHATAAAVPSASSGPPTSVEGGPGGCAAAGGGAPESTSAAAAQRLRDKFYLFGVSLKPRLFGSKNKAAELEAAGSAIKGAEIKCGFLMKRAHHKSSWKRRWFVLSPFALAYYDNPAVATPNGVILTAEILAVSTLWDPALCKAGPQEAGAAGGGRERAATAPHPAAAAVAAAAAATAGAGGAHPSSASSASSSHGGVGAARGPTASGRTASVRGSRGAAGAGGGEGWVGDEGEGAPPGGDPPPSDVAAMSCIFYVYTAHRAYTFQAANDRDRLRWLYALDCARRGDAEAVRAAERSGYSGLGGATIAAWLLSHATLCRVSLGGADGGGAGGGGGGICGLYSVAEGEGGLLTVNAGVASEEDGLEEGLPVTASGTPSSSSPSHARPGSHGGAGAAGGDTAAAVAAFLVGRGAAAASPQPPVAAAAGRRTAGVESGASAAIGVAPARATAVSTWSVHTSFSDAETDGQGGTARPSLPPSASMYTPGQPAAAMPEWREEDDEAIGAAAVEEDEEGAAAGAAPLVHAGGAAAGTRSGHDR